MTDLHKAAQQALEAWQRYLLGECPQWKLMERFEALRAALAQQQAGSWQDGVLEGHLRERERWLAQEQAEPRGGCNLPPPLQAEPVEPVAWYQKRGQEVLTSHPACWGREDEPWTPLYTAPPQRKPLSLTDLQEALVLTNLIDRDAIDDPEEYDEGSTLAQIDELHRIIKEGV